MPAARGPPKITVVNIPVGFPRSSLSSTVLLPQFITLTHSSNLKIFLPFPNLHSRSAVSILMTVSLINSTITRDACGKCASGEGMRRVSRSLFPKAKTSPCQPAHNIPCLPYPVTHKANTGNEQCKTSLFAFNQSSCSEQSKIMPFC